MAVRPWEYRFLNTSMQDEEAGNRQNRLGKYQSNSSCKKPVTSNSNLTSEKRCPSYSDGCYSSTTKSSNTKEVTAASVIKTKSDSSLPDLAEEDSSRPAIDLRFHSNPTERSRLVVDQQGKKRLPLPNNGESLFSIHHPSLSQIILVFTVAFLLIILPSLASLHLCFA